MKNKKGLKIFLIVFVAVVLAATILATTVFQPTLMELKWKMNLKETEAVSDSKVLEYFKDESKYSYDINEISKEIDGYYDWWWGNVNNEGEEWVATAKEVPAECDKYFDNLNSLIAKFFKENYSVSVEEDLAVYNVKMVDIPEDYSLTGFYMFYMPDEERPEKIGDMSIDEVEKTIFLNSRNIEMAYIDGVWFFEELAGKYIHETIHYLGFKNADRSMHSVIEGFTEALTIELMDYCNYDYYSSSYIANVPLAQQIIMVNKNVVSEMIATEKYADEVLITELTKVLTKEQVHDLGEAHNAINFSTKDYGFYDGNYKCLEIAQYLTAEYCKGFELTDNEICHIYDHFIVPIYDIQ